MQHKLSEGKLLDKDGNLVEAGYAFSLVKEYHRCDIKAKKGRIKEWDYYYIGNNKRGIALTIDDNSYMGLGSVSILDFEKKTYITKSGMKFFTKGKVGFPSSSTIGDVEWNHKNYHLKFSVQSDKRVLDVHVDNYHLSSDFDCHFVLEETTDGSMVIATPFDKPKHFYYNQKINCMKASGSYTFNGETYEFSDKDTRAVLDWGRGVWTYKNTWYWSSLSTVMDDKEIGFNLGYGFGDTSKASENMLFYDKKAYKLEDVIFNIPKDEKGKYEYLKPWTVTSKDLSINLSFTPILDRKDLTDIIIIKSLQHQVFGYFNGTIKVDNMTINIKDSVGFAERVTNHW